MTTVLILFLSLTIIVIVGLLIYIRHLKQEINGLDLEAKYWRHLDINQDYEKEQRYAKDLIALRKN